MKLPLQDGRWFYLGGSDKKSHLKDGQLSYEVY